MNTRKRREKNRRNRWRKTAERFRGWEACLDAASSCDLRPWMRKYFARTYAEYRLGERGWPGRPWRTAT